MMLATHVTSTHHGEHSTSNETNNYMSRVKHLSIFHPFQNIYRFRFSRNKFDKIYIKNINIYNT